MENNKEICIECGGEFEITGGWEKLMRENPEMLPPKRCYSCRQKRKSEKLQGNSNNY